MKGRNEITFISVNLKGVYFLLKSGIFIITTCLTGCAAGGREIADKPIQFDNVRSELSLQYLYDRYGIAQSVPAIDPKLVVIHHTVIPTMQETYEAFYPPALPDTRGEIQGAGMLNVSAHFLVDRDGTIYRLLPETTMARHVIGLNHCAIGIENVGGTSDLPLTRAQLKANIWLVNYLNEKYSLDYVIGHHEYRLFERHELWKEHDSAYRTIKTDPGKKFMRKVRRATKSANFKPLPKPLTDV
jgi:hypothetical protein